MCKRIFAGFVLLMIITLSSTVLAAPKIDDILKKIDDMSLLNSDLTAKVVATQQIAGQGIKVYEYVYYRRDASDSFLIIMTAPEVEKGNGYLKQGDNYWMYRRNTRTFQHINQDASISGSDSKVEDIKEKLTEMYTSAVDELGNEKISETKLGDIPVYKLEIQARNEDITYSKRLYWVRKDNYFPLKAQSFSLSGTLMRTVYFYKYTPVGGRYILIKGMFVNEFEKGNKTLAEVKDISFRKIDDYVFTKAYLENLSK